METSKNNTYYVVKISDTGSGIEPEKLPHIFSRFKNSSEVKDSFGLGLALAKKISDYHKIDIKVESEVGKGTTFILQFPLS